MAATGSDLGSCGEYDLGIIGCFDFPEMTFISIVSLAPPIFFALSKFLTGVEFRKKTYRFLYEGSWSTSYTALLNKALEWLTWLFGDSLSLRALSMCFRLALVYAAACFLFIVLVNFVLDIGGLFPSGFSIGFVLLYIFFQFSLVRYVKIYIDQNRTPTTSYSRQFLEKIRDQVICLLILIFSNLTLFLYVEVYSVLLEIVFGTSASSEGVIEFSILIGSTFILMAYLGPIFSMLTVVTYLGITLYLFYYPEDDIGDAYDLIKATVGFMFFLVLLNALFDWLSWAVSRWLMIRLALDATKEKFHRRFSLLLGHVTLDILIAVACLFGLTILLINLIHTVYDAETWNRYFGYAEKNPISLSGIFMMIMLFSTVIPTAIHLFFAVFALAAIKPPFRSKISMWIAGDTKGADEAFNRTVVSAYLTFWCIFGLVVIWIASIIIFGGFDWIWLNMGWSDSSEEYPFWSSIFEVAKKYLIIGSDGK